MRGRLQAALGVLLLIGGCVEPCEQVEAELPPVPSGAGQAPVLVRGEWGEGKILTLEFSAPLSPSDEIATERFALLRWVTFVSDAQTCALTTSQYSMSTTVTQATIDPDQPHLLRLKTSSFAGCLPRLRTDELPNVAQGLIVLYSDFPGAGMIETADGVPLRGFGPPELALEWQRCVGLEGLDPSLCIDRIPLRIGEGVLPDHAEFADIPCKEEA